MRQANDPGLQALLEEHAGEPFPCPLCGGTVPLQITKIRAGYFSCDTCGLRAFFNAYASLASFIGNATRPPFVSDAERAAAEAWAQTHIDGYQYYTPGTLVELYLASQRDAGCAETAESGLPGACAPEAIRMKSLLERYAGTVFPCPTCRSPVSLRRPPRGNGFICCRRCGLTCFFNSLLSLSAIVRLASRPTVNPAIERTGALLWARHNLKGYENIPVESVVECYRSAQDKPGRWV